MKCSYRNCENEFIGRSNKKFCKIQCKRNEAKYRKRKLVKYTDIDKKLIEILNEF